MQLVPHGAIFPNHISTLKLLAQQLQLRFSLENAISDLCICWLCSYLNYILSQSRHDLFWMTLPYVFSFF